MGLIVRPYTYIANSVIVADQNNANENLLYSTINGGITDDNLGVVTESAITFGGVGGHEHGGGTSGLKIDLAQDTSPDDFLIQLVSTGTGSALKAITTAAGKSAVHATGAAATAFGVYANNSSAGSVALLAENTGLGSGAEIRNVTGLSTHALVVKNQSTDATVRAGIHIPTVATATHYGLWIQNVAGIPIRIDQTGAGAGNAIQIVGDRSSPMILLTPSGTGAGLRVNASAVGTGIFINHSSTTGATGLDIDMTGTTGAQKGITVDIDSTSASTAGILVNSAASGGSASTGITCNITGSGTALNLSSTHSSGDVILATGAKTSGAAPFTFSNTGAATSTLDVTAVTTNTQALQVNATISDTGGLSTQKWAAVVTTGAAGSLRNGLLVLGRIFCNGEFTATFGKGFLNPHPRDAGKALNYVCLEGPENAVFWRTRGETPIPEGNERGWEAFEPCVTRIPVPDWVILALPVREQMDVIASAMLPCLIGAWHDVETQEIVVQTSQVGVPFSVFCLGTRRYFEKHEPVVDHDWSEMRKHVGSPAHRAYGPN